MTRERYHDPASLVTRAMPGLAVTVCPTGDRSAYLATDEGCISVGSLASGEVLLTTSVGGEVEDWTLLEFHLTALQAVEVAYRLIRMATYMVVPQTPKTPDSPAKESPATPAEP
jgi:hypothetical protein